MIFNFALLSNLLLASGALAVPSSRLEDRLALRDKSRQSQPLSPVMSSPLPFYVESSLIWGGVVLADSNGTFTLVSGTFTVPTPTGKSGSASIWVGIDGNPNCPQVLLQTGISFSITMNQVYYQAWYQWYPVTSAEFFNYGIDIRPGDVITATAAANNTAFGTAVLENHTTNQTVYKDIQGSSSTALCGASAEWIVEDYKQNGVIVPFANFSTVTFTGTYASGPDGQKHYPSDSDAYVVDIVQNNTVLTYVTPHRDNITIQYVGGLL